ncbi:dihydrofolate reductase [Solirubrobacter phytolaccae]|uniref:Dihydrofolate reductase n=1 Tax=Solirubrobacter phytolaccae TaxID=1404360 RepID=A0A9X3NKH9_9ACTN|nr:dihydrofolate reductase [Solirubrobacter phytolaccae]MDA0185261.1 dihydrofolate reductase [Solirubrobacter phytolaccae]
MKRDIHVVAAVANGGIVGHEGKMPWHLPPDLRRFRQLTRERTVVMGLSTWESLGGPLRERENIVLCPEPSRVCEGALVIDSLAAAAAVASRSGPVFVIGGHRPWVEALTVASTLHLTRIHRDFVGDVVFPSFDATQWREIHREVGEHPIDGVPTRYEFLTFVRRATVTGSRSHRPRPGTTTLSG